MWFLVGFLVVLLIIGLYLLLTYNSLVRSRNDVEEGFSTMDVYMKKRYDLVPNLVAVVKGYAAHEKETLTKVIEARNMAMKSSTFEEKVANENAFTQTLKSLFALSENYPDLKANTNFINLQEQLKQIETDIANSRKYYNAVVKTYNNRIEIFPNSVVAKWFKFTRKLMFEIDSAEERKNVKVEF